MVRVFGEQRLEVSDRRRHVRPVALVVAALDRLGQFGRHVGRHYCSPHADEPEDQLTLSRPRPQAPTAGQPDLSTVLDLAMSG
jgi:hypothetical protein